jgi:hypothetical protein
MHPDIVGRGLPTCGAAFNEIEESLMGERSAVRLLNVIKAIERTKRYYGSS